MDAIINPYSGINWNNCLQAPSLSHAHSRIWQYGEKPKADLQKYIDRANMAGIKHVAWSNYHDPEPFYPLTDWFETIPSGMIGSPNAEFPAFTDIGYTTMHVNALGSFISGPHITQRAWRTFFKQILNQLQFDDAGGITINHPIYSNLNAELILPLLRYDPRVLGIEIVNSWMIAPAGEIATAIWDNVLSEGQRAWGFCVPDHGVEDSSNARFTGKNILLVDELTEHKCLKAYREGHFYSKIFDSELAFTDISYDNDTNVFHVVAPLADSIRVYVNGEYTEYESNNISVTIPQNAKYCRAEAWMSYDWADNNGTMHEVDERIFTNPIMFVESKYEEKRTELDFLQRVLD